jgi:surface antigen/endonuclease/exonuclease/phosphatase family metal-dependent hydrolase
MGEPAYQLPEDDKPDIRPHLRALEGGGETTEPKTGHLREVGSEDTTASLGDKEENAASDSSYGPSTADDIKNRLNAPGRGGKHKQSGLSRMMGGKSKLKKRAAIALAAAGGSAIAAMFIFILMLPLKIESLVTNLDNHFGAASSQAMDEESANLLNAWIRRDIIGNLNKGTCRTTVSSGCVSVDKGAGPVSKLFNAWKQGKVEQKLATKYNIVLGKKAGNFYIAFPEGTATISAADEKAFREGKLDIFTAAERNPDFKKQKITRNQIRGAVKTALAEETLSRRVYDRFQLGRYMEKKYGIKRCIIACDIRDEFTDKITDKKKFAKSVFIERVVAPMSKNYAFLAGCILQGGGGDCSTKPDDASSSDSERTSSGERNVTRISVELAQSIGKESAEELAKKAQVIADEGLQKYLVRSLVTKIAAFVGQGSGDVAGQAATKAIPIVGWVLLAGQLAHAAKDIGPMIQYLGYAIKATASVQTYYVYATAASELKSGHVDATEMGTLSSALGSNLTGSKDDRSDATQTPLYGQINGTSNVTSAIIVGSASASGTSGNTGYLCNNGKPPNEVVCPEENLAGGNKVSNAISDWYDHSLGSLPGANVAVDFINFVGNLPGDALGWLLKHIDSKLYCNNVVSPGCVAAKSLFEKYGPDLLKSLTDKIFQPIVTDNMSGGRTYDVMAAGADVSKNQSCQVLLGCAKVSDKQAAAIRGQYLATQKKQFESQSMFARMFSTDSPYSLVSRIALAMPSSAGSARNQAVAGLVHNPLGMLGSMFSTMLTGGRVSADTGSTEDPFGVPQVAYSSLPDNPDQYWDQNCVTGPMAKYDSSTNKLDVSDWLNAQKQDPDSGQPMPDVTNPCLLIYNLVINNGAKYDASLIPEDLLNTSTEGLSSGGGKYTVATYNIRVPGQHNGDSDGTAPVEQRADRAAQLLKDQNVDIVGFQEIADPTRNALNNALTDYDKFPHGKSDGPDKSWLTPIYWLNDRFKRVDQGYVGNIWRDCSHQTTVLCDKNPWVKLEDKETGQQLYVLSTHLLNQPIGVEFGGGPQREASAKAIIDWANSKQTADTPVILLGDFNSDYRPAADDVDIGKNPDRLPYCLFSRSDYVDSYDAVNSNSGYCPSRNASFQTLPYRIDHVYMSKSIAKYATGEKIIRNADTHFISDHPPTLATINIPVADDGSGSSPGKDFVGNDGFPGGQCTDYVKYILNRHSSNYRGSASLGDGKDVARNLGNAPYNYKVDHTPSIHAVVSFGTQFADPTYGHVALVGQINKDGSIVVEESNWSNPLRYGTHTVPASEVPKLTYAHTEVGWH